MNTRKLKGRAPTLRDQLRAGTARKVAPSTLDASAFGPQFLGPPTPRHILISRLPQGWETTRHWHVADDLKRYGRVDHSQSSAPYLGDVFGYGQPTQEVQA